MQPQVDRGGPKLLVSARAAVPCESRTGDDRGAKSTTVARPRKPGATAAGGVAARSREDIDRGRYSWFIARVQALRAGVELASDYLGGCLYENPRDMMKPGDYFEDMVQTVIDEARAELPRLIAALEN